MVIFLGQICAYIHLVWNNQYGAVSLNTPGHPWTPQDVQICIINMLFLLNYVSLYKKYY